jgi:hypothetical protein
MRLARFRLSKSKSECDIVLENTCPRQELSYLFEGLRGSAPEATCLGVFMNLGQQSFGPLGLIDEQFGACPGGSGPNPGLSKFIGHDQVARTGPGAWGFG